MHWRFSRTSTHFSPSRSSRKPSSPVLLPKREGRKRETSSQRLLCQTFFFALFLRRFVPVRRGSFFGSPVAAFSTTPPSSSAISASVRLVKTEYGCVSATSSPSFAYSSLCFISSHCRSRVRTSTNPPFNFLPSTTNLSSPLASARETFVVFSGA